MSEKGMKYNVFQNLIPIIEMNHSLISNKLYLYIVLYFLMKELV